jgi:hypothetical protein
MGKNDFLFTKFGKNTGTSAGMECRQPASSLDKILNKPTPCKHPALPRFLPPLEYVPAG